MMHERRKELEIIGTVVLGVIVFVMFIGLIFFAFASFMAMAEYNGSPF